MHGLSGGRWPALGKPEAPPSTRPSKTVQRYNLQGSLFRENVADGSCLSSHNGSFGRTPIGRRNKEDEGDNSPTNSSTYTTAYRLATVSFKSIPNPGRSGKRRRLSTISSAGSINSARQGTSP